MNAFGGYEIFRDELYYLACADHLAFGYVDQPPLSIWLLAGVRSVLGDSLFAIRLLPALAGAALVFVTGLITRELGGGRFAVTVAALCPLVAGQVLAVSSFWSMNVFDLLLVAVAALLLARLLNTGDGRYWIAVGAVLGLALLNKVGVLWVGLGLAVGLAATGERRWLRTPWPWAGGALAALLFLPYVAWNAAHEWAHLEFIESAVAGKYSGLSAWSFLSGQVLVQNPVTVPVWLAGLGWLLAAPGGRRYRILGVVWVTAFVVLFLNGSSKAGYLANVYAPVFAVGGVAWERLLPRRGPQGAWPGARPWPSCSPGSSWHPSPRRSCRWRAMSATPAPWGWPPPPTRATSSPSCPSSSPTCSAGGRRRRPWPPSTTPCPPGTGSGR
ncbi:MAG: ArnT family glycosyltransferase [Thermoanaerobaculia bacterium]